MSQSISPFHGSAAMGSIGLEEHVARCEIAAAQEYLAGAAEGVHVAGAALAVRAAHALQRDGLCDRLRATTHRPCMLQQQK